MDALADDLEGTASLTQLNVVSADLSTDDAQQACDSIRQSLAVQTCGRQSLVGAPSCNFPQAFHLILAARHPTEARDNAYSPLGTIFHDLGTICSGTIFHDFLPLPPLCCLQELQVRCSCSLVWEDVIEVLFHANLQAILCGDGPLQDTYSPSQRLAI